MKAADPHDYAVLYAGKIKPCPFCGKPPEVWGSGEQERGLMLHCVTAGCANPSVSYYSHEDSLRVWNTRF